MKEEECRFALAELHIGYALLSDRNELLRVRFEAKRERHDASPKAETGTCYHVADIMRGMPKCRS